MSRSVVAGFAYHDVTDEPGTSGLQRPGAMPYKLGRQAFARHLDAIASSAVAPELVTRIDLARPGRYVLLTFDDGGRSALDIGDELCRRGWRGHFFVVTSLIGTATFLDAAGLRQLRSAGHVIGSHSHTHPDIFRELPPERMLVEWGTSCEILSDILGEACRTASVPGGDISPVVLESARAAGLHYLFTSEPWLVPRTIGDCWVLGRFCPKRETPPERVHALAQFRGWKTALLVREVKNLARRTFPRLYRRYMRRMTTPAQRVPP
jgi:peptidoglycan/xylan/chitin deacetylase (PgdA/CDA1 family)